MDDLISRQAAIDVIRKCHVKEVTPAYRLIEKSEALMRMTELPTAHRPVDEWCTDCSEYDSEKHCCPRFNMVIRSAMDERKHGKWIDLHPQGDSRFMCSVCKWKEHVPTCMGKPTVWEYCPSCGARMDGDENG